MASQSARNCKQKKKLCVLDPGSMFKKYDLQRLEEELEDLDSLSLIIGSQSMSKKLLIRTVVGFELHCKRKCKQQTIEVIKLIK